MIEEMEQDKEYEELKKSLRLLSRISREQGLVINSVRVPGFVYKRSPVKEERLMGITCVYDWHNVGGFIDTRGE